MKRHILILSIICMVLLSACMVSQEKEYVPYFSESDCMWIECREKGNVKDFSETDFSCLSWLNISSTPPECRKRYVSEENWKVDMIEDTPELLKLRACGYYFKPSYTAGFNHALPPPYDYEYLEKRQECKAWYNVSGTTFRFYATGRNGGDSTMQIGFGYFIRIVDNCQGELCDYINSFTLESGGRTKTCKNNTLVINDWDLGFIEKKPYDCSKLYNLTDKMRKDFPNLPYSAPFLP